MWWVYTQAGLTLQTLNFSLTLCSVWFCHKATVIYVNITNGQAFLMEAHNALCNLRTRSFFHYYRDQFIIPKFNITKNLSLDELSNLSEEVLKKHFKLVNLQ